MPAQANALVPSAETSRALDAHDRDPRFPETFQAPIRLFKYFDGRSFTSAGNEPLAFSSPRATGGATAAKEQLLNSALDISIWRTDPLRRLNQMGG
jgi:hypothetical protein